MLFFGVVTDILVIKIGAYNEVQTFYLIMAPRDVYQFLLGL